MESAWPATPSTSGGTGGSAGASLAVMLAAAGWWGLAYALELASSPLSARLFWGDAKWLGIALLPVAFYAFIMQYTGHQRWVNRRAMAALAVVPVATIALRPSRPPTTWSATTRRRPTGRLDRGHRPGRACSGRSWSTPTWSSGAPRPCSPGP